MSHISSRHLAESVKGVVKTEKSDGLTSGEVWNVPGGNNGFKIAQVFSEKTTNSSVNLNLDLDTAADYIVEDLTTSGPKLGSYTATGGPDPFDGIWASNGDTELAGTNGFKGIITSTSSNSGVYPVQNTFNKTDVGEYIEFKPRLVMTGNVYMAVMLGSIDPTTIQSSDPVNASGTKYYRTPAQLTANNYDNSVHHLRMEVYDDAGTAKVTIDIINDIDDSLFLHLGYIDISSLSGELRWVLATSFNTDIVEFIESGREAHLALLDSQLATITDLSSINPGLKLITSGGDELVVSSVDTEANTVEVDVVTGEVGTGGNITSASYVEFVDYSSSAFAGLAFDNGFTQLAPGYTDALTGFGTTGTHTESPAYFTSGTLRRDSIGSYIKFKYTWSNNMTLWMLPASTDATTFSGLSVNAGATPIPFVTGNVNAEYTEATQHIHVEIIDDGGTPTAQLSIRDDNNPTVIVATEGNGYTDVTGSAAVPIGAIADVDYRFVLTWYQVEQVMYEIRSNLDSVDGGVQLVKSGSNMLNATLENPLHKFSVSNNVIGPYTPYQTGVTLGADATLYTPLQFTRLDVGSYFRWKTTTSFTGTAFITLVLNVPTVGTYAEQNGDNVLSAVNAATVTDSGYDETLHYYQAEIVDVGGPQMQVTMRFISDDTVAATIGVNRGITKSPVNDSTPLGFSLTFPTGPYHAIYDIEWYSPSNITPDVGPKWVVPTGNSSLINVNPSTGISEISMEDASGASAFVATAGDKIIALPTTVSPTGDFVVKALNDTKTAWVDLVTHTDPYIIEGTHMADLGTGSWDTVDAWEGIVDNFNVNIVIDPEGTIGTYSGPMYQILGKAGYEAGIAALSGTTTTFHQAILPASDQYCNVYQTYANFFQTGVVSHYTVTWEETYQFSPVQALGEVINISVTEAGNMQLRRNGEVVYTTVGTIPKDTELVFTVHNTTDAHDYSSDTNYVVTSDEKPWKYRNALGNLVVPSSHGDDNPSTTPFNEGNYLTDYDSGANYSVLSNDVDFSFPTRASWHLFDGDDTVTAWYYDNAPASPSATAFTLTFDTPKSFNKYRVKVAHSSGTYGAFFTLSNPSGTVHTATSTTGIVGYTDWYTFEASSLSTSLTFTASGLEGLMYKIELIETPATLTSIGALSLAYEADPDLILGNDQTLYYGGSALTAGEFFATANGPSLTNDLGFTFGLKAELGTNLAPRIDNMKAVLNGTSSRISLENLTYKFYESNNTVDIINNGTDITGNIKAYVL